MSHPYVGLPARFRVPKQPLLNRDGIVVFVGQGGSINEESEAYPSVTLLLADGTHFEGHLSFLVVDPAEATRRIATGGGAA